MADTYSGKAFSIGLSLFVIVLALYAVLQSPFFAVRTLELSGNAYLTEEAVLSHTGLELGVNMLDVDVGALARQLLELPYLAEARVSRRLPGRIVVTVRERAPVAYLTDAGLFYAVAGDGIILYPVQTPRGTLPLVTAEPPVAPKAGDVLAAPYLVDALDFAAALSVKWRADISEIHASPERIVAYTQSRVTIELGTDGRMAEKASVLEALMERAGQGNLALAHVDLRLPRNPVVERRR